MFEIKSEIEKKIEKNVMRVEKPARYIGGELHSVRKSPESVKMRVAFGFPDLY